MRPVPFAILILFLAVFLSGSTLFTQSTDPIASNYIVVAAYGKSWESLAIDYKNKVSDDYPEVTYAFFEGKNMFMVYLEESQDFDYSVDKMRKVREGGKYLKTWVFVYKGGGKKEVAEAEPEETEEVAVVLEETEIVETENNEDIEKEEEIVVEVSPSSETIVEEEITEDLEETESVGKYKIYFNVYNSLDNKLINADVELIDPTRGRNFETVSSNALIRTNGPANSTSDMQTVVDYFGFRKMIHTFNLEEPMVDSTAYFVSVQGDSMIIDMPLVKFRRGDIFTLFHVYFFSHSSVMKPESQYELNQLLAMLDDSPNLKIKLHGHTNGSSKGLTRSHEQDDPDFFTLQGTTEKTSSAKELSEMRANEVKRYLTFNNVDPSRIEVIGWGGRKMLYKKLDQNADRNVRVEVEIIEE